jgi:hypothetical protein
LYEKQIPSLCRLPRKVWLPTSTLPVQLRDFSFWISEWFGPQSILLFFGLREQLSSYEFLAPFLLLREISTNYIFAIFQESQKTSFLRNFFYDHINTLQTQCVLCIHFIFEERIWKNFYQRNFFFAFLPALLSFDLSIYLPKTNDVLNNCSVYVYVYVLHTSLGS